MSLQPGLSGFFFNIKKNQVSVSVWIYICIFDLIPLIHLYVFMPMPSSIVELEVGDSDAFRNSFIVQDYFGYPGSFVFPYEVEYYFFKVWELCWDFDGDCVEYVCCFGKMKIFYANHIF